MMVRGVLGTMVVLMACSLAVAQETPQTPPPTKEHEWLKQFLGEWESEAESVAVPGMPAMKCTGAMKTRALGGYWIISDVTTEMMGTKVEAVQTIGYDPEKKKYVGTWVDSMFNHMWKYEGSVDETGKILTLEAEGPNFFGGGGTAMYRDVYEFKSKDHVLASSQMQGADGKWITFMTGNARRKGTK
jgi:hypothetical protein